jgi:hypothetical protein
MVYFYLLIQDLLFTQVKMMASSNREKKNTEQTKTHLFYYNEKIKNNIKNLDSAMMMMDNIY